MVSINFERRAQYRAHLRTPPPAPVRQHFDKSELVLETAEAGEMYCAERANHNVNWLVKRRNKANKKFGELAGISSNLIERVELVRIFIY